MTLVLLVFAGNTDVSAEQKYNPYERTWDMAPDDYQQKYNPHNISWETTTPDSEPQYNPYKKMGISALKKYGK